MPAGSGDRAQIGARCYALPANSLPVLFRRPFEPAERAPPFRHPDHDLEPVGGGDQIGRAGGGAEQSLDLEPDWCLGLSRSTVPMAPVISRTLWPRSTSNRRFRAVLLAT